MMMRTILAILTCSVVLPAQPSPTVTGTYHFTTPQSAQSLKEAESILKAVASMTEVSADIPTAKLTFNGPVGGVNFAEWVLPQIDKAAGDDAVHEYKSPSGDIGRVNFLPNLQKPQELQELLTILRTVADVQKIFTFSSNRAIILLAPEWQVSFSEWIIDQLQQKPDSAPREFTVGGPDYRGLGHGARLNFLSNMTSPQQSQETLTVLRTVGDVQKVFSFSSRPALILRAGDSDLQRAEWIIQQLDLPAGQASGPASFTVQGTDDATRVFRLRNADPQAIQTAVTGIRSELNIKKVFPTYSPTNIAVRGTAEQIASTATWMTVHTMSFE